MVALARCTIASATALGGLLRCAEHARIVSSGRSRACQSAGAAGKADLIAASDRAASTAGACWARHDVALEAIMKRAAAVVRMLSLSNQRLSPGAAISPPAA